MKPLHVDAPLPIEFFMKDLEYLPRTIYHILCNTLCPVKGFKSTSKLVRVMKNVVYNITYGIRFNMHHFFLRVLATIAIAPYDQKAYAPWIMRFIRHHTNIPYEACGRNHIVLLPKVEVLHDTIYPPSGNIPVEEGPSYVNHVEAYVVFNAKAYPQKRQF